MPMLRHLCSSRILTLAYIVLTIYILTLNPFQFHPEQSEKWWIWRFWLPDIFQNILLFLPLGILLRHNLNLPYSLCLLWGFLLSFSIETAQLFTPVRTSNFVDLITNSTGSVIGGWLYSVGLCKTKLAWNNNASASLPTAIMLLPLCWVRVMILDWQLNGTWILLPNIIALLFILQSASRQPFLLNQTQLIVLLLALAPLATERPLLFLPLAGISLIVHALANRSGIPSYYLAVGTLGISLGFIISLNSLWIKYLFHHFGEGWHNLQWIEILLSLTVLISALVWGKVDRSKTA